MTFWKFSINNPKSFDTSILTLFIAPLVCFHELALSYLKIESLLVLYLDLFTDDKIPETLVFFL